MIELSHITKRFGAMRAVDDVSLTIERGSIVAIAGENGAGKTTLMRIAAGELAADEGDLRANGHVELVHQHFQLVNELTIAENLALTGRGFRFATRRSVEASAAEVIAATGIALGDVRRRAGELAVGEKAKLELIKAISRNPSTLILDEPTSVLTPAETAELFAVMRRLAANGTAVVFISHKLPEVLSVAQRVVVMRGGRVVLDATDATREQLVDAMIVGAAGLAPPMARDDGGASPAAPTVIAKNLSGETLRDLSFEVRKRETIAIVGVAGNGQSELASMLRGLTKPKAGTLTIDASHTGHIPEDRTRDGIVAPMTIAENLALSSRRWSPRRAAQHAEQMIALYSIRAQGPRQLAGSLSGGNQQKVILARELDPRPELIVAAEPTRGLDLEATRFVHEQLRNAAAAGAAIVLITSDLDEAFALADGLHVIYRGTLSPRLTPEEASTRVGALMAGVA